MNRPPSTFDRRVAVENRRPTGSGVGKGVLEKHGAPVLARGVLKKACTLSQLDAVARDTGNRATVVAGPIGIEGRSIPNNDTGTQRGIDGTPVQQSLIVVQRAVVQHESCTQTRHVHSTTGTKGGAAMLDGGSKKSRQGTYVLLGHRSEGRAGREALQQKATTTGGVAWGTAKQ